MKSRPFVTFLGTALVLGAVLFAFATNAPDTLAQQGPASAPLAQPTVTKKLNADRVDNFHAAAAPKKNRLLALDANARFPDSVMPDSIQRRVTGTCAAGSSIRVINANGTVTCEADDSGGGGAGWGLTGNAGTNPGSNFIGTSDNQAFVLRTNNAERVRVLANGTVGIGTTSPNANLAVLKTGGVLPSVQSVPTGVKVGVPDGTVPMALRQNAPESSTPALLYLETSNGDLGGLAASSGSMLLYAATGKELGLNVGGVNRALTVKPNKHVGIGTVDPFAWLTVKGDSTGGGSVVFSVTNPNDTNLFSVYGDGTVAVNKLSSSAVTRHVCLNGNVLSECSSAAEYVPSIDSGKGFPETADLVSMAPEINNPYADEHGPFVVQKSAKACDNNLLGFIVKPESGADGVKKNDHYLPLAIYGYFPAKVSMENGTIKRGDPLTSSSKPGYAMKATGACKIIGYALEDATKEGQIQVFANTGESTASTVTKLQGELNLVKQENKELKDTLAAVQARLAAIELELDTYKSVAQVR